MYADCLYDVQTIRIGADEEIDDTKGLKPEEITKRIQEKEAKVHAQILEMVSDTNSSVHDSLFVVLSYQNWPSHVALLIVAAQCLFALVSVTAYHYL